MFCSCCVSTYINKVKTFNVAKYTIFNIRHFRPRITIPLNCNCTTTIFSVYTRETTNKCSWYRLVIWHYSTIFMHETICIVFCTSSTTTIFSTSCYWRSSSCFISSILITSSIRFQFRISSSSCLINNFVNLCWSPRTIWVLMRTICIPLR